MAQARIWWLAAWTGRLLLLGAVAFWWGAVVIPQLLRLSFPRLPASITPWQLDPGLEGNVATAVSAAGLCTVALLALAAAVRSRGRRSGWVGVGGWAALAATAAYLAWDEVAAFHETLRPAFLGEQISEVDRAFFWPVLLSPLILAFVAVMGIFARRALRNPVVRAPFVLALVAWLLVVAHELSFPFVFKGRADVLGVLIEETLEFGGTLLFGLGAALALRGDAAAQVGSGGFALRRVSALLVGMMAVVAVLGSLAAVFLFRAPLIEARAPGAWADSFVIKLEDQEAVVQEFRMPAAPVRFLEFRFSNCAPSRGPAIAAVRVTHAGVPSSVLSRGSVRIPVGDCPRRHAIELLPPLTATEGQRLAAHVAADVEQGSDLGVGATKDRYAAGGLSVNGVAAWPDQHLDFVAFGAAEPSASKLHGLWHLFRSDWRWPVLAVDLVISLALITLLPMLLLAGLQATATRSGR